MTVIAAIKDATGVYVGADSYGSSRSCQIQLDKKIFRLANGYMAITGSYRGHQIIRETFPELYAPIISSKDVYELAEWMRSAFNRHGLDKEGEKGKFPESEFGCLFVTKDKIWRIEDNYQFHEHENFFAEGCGRQYTMGALYALRNVELAAAKRLRLAIETACVYHPYVGGDIVIIGPVE